MDQISNNYSTAVMQKKDIRYVCIFVVIDRSRGVSHPVDVEHKALFYLLVHKTLLFLLFNYNKYLFPHLFNVHETLHHTNA